jgi:hypothetical protein
MLVLLCLLVQGIWAQNSVITVSTAKELTSAITDGANIQLTANIQLSSYLDVDGKNVTIDLNGHTLSRNLTEHDHAGHVIYAHNGSTLTLTSSVAGGSIEGGRANNGGAINITHGSTVSATNVIFQNNSAADHAGAVWNNGTFTATSCTFTNNRANDVGAIYNAVQTESNVTYAGSATLTNCSFTGNEGNTGAGALANALGDTEMTIIGGTIQDNTSGSRGAGIWNGGTLNMKGAVTVKDNKDVGGVVTNVFLKSGKVITVTGSLAGSKIGVDLEDLTGTFTSGYSNYNSGVAPNTIFTIDRSSILALEQDGGEVRLISFNPNPLSYIERSWDDTNKKVVITEKALKRQINDEDTPAEGDYKEVTSAPTDNPEQWLGMGGYSTTVPEYYVVQGDVNRETIVVQGTNVHLILCDGATLTLTGGLKLEGDNKLYIHCQSYGGSMGRLMVTNKYSGAAGIGSAKHEGKPRVAGELVIYGGHIEATGGTYAAGIGSCSRIEYGHEALCKSVTVYGGYVKAKGGSGAAGIGGGSYYYYDTPVYIGVDGGQLILYDGTVIAQGGNDAAGVGGGEYGNGGTVTVYGGSLTATGKEDGAGIGGGSFKNDSKTSKLTGGKLTVYGGMVTATGGDYAAGIGGGYDGGGAEVNISGGTVTATGGENGAGIGGGYWSRGGIVTITGGTVIAKAGTQGGDDHRAIGPGQSNENYGTLTIGNTMMVGAGNSGSVERIYDADERKNACWYRSYAEISPCTHPGATYTVSGTNADGTHTKHCSHCTTTFEAEPHDFEGSECSVCHYQGTVYTVTIYLPVAGEDGKYTTNGAYMTYTYNMVAGTSFTLPGAPQDLYDMEFAGWLVGTLDGITSYKASSSETLLAEKTPYTLEGDVNFVARYKDIVISLADGSDNGEKLYTYNGRLAASVTLTGRTLWKDGDWNTLCLPFSLTAAQLADSPLAGATIKTLESSEFSEGTLTLNFTPDANNLTAIEAGKPYLVKWAATTPDHIENSVFSNVIISKDIVPVPATTGYVKFIGTTSPFTFTANDRSMLYLGGGSTLYYPSTAMSIGSCRAIFQLNGIEAGDPSEPQQGNVRAFKLNFGEDATGILSTTNYTNLTNSVYDLQGRKLNGKPTQKGVYIYKGKKVVIKK